MPTTVTIENPAINPPFDESARLFVSANESIAWAESTSALPQAALRLRPADAELTFPLQARDLSEWT